MLKALKAGPKTPVLCRKHGISEATPQNWKSNYEGMIVSEAQRSRGLEAENGKLRQLLTRR